MTKRPSGQRELKLVDAGAARHSEAKVRRMAAIVRERVKEQRELEELHRKRELEQNGKSKEAIAAANGSKPEASAMADLIAGLPRSGLSVILIEHNLPEVMRVCPNIYVQANGRGLALGPADEIMAMPEVRQAYLGKDV